MTLSWCRIRRVRTRPRHVTMGTLARSYDDACVAGLPVSPWVLVSMTQESFNDIVPTCDRSILLDETHRS